LGNFRVPTKSLAHNEKTLDITYLFGSQKFLICYNIHMDISELSALPAAQKIQIIGELWNEVIESKEPINLSPEVIAEIEKRRAQLRTDPSSAIDRDELWRQVDESRKRDG